MNARALRYRARGMTLVCAAFLLASCSSDSQGEGADLPEIVARPDRDGVVFDAEIVAAFAKREGANDAQVKMLQDGQLSFREYESLVLATERCSRERGVAVVNRGINSSLGYPVVELAVPDGSLATYDECNKAESFAAETVWMLGHSPEVDESNGPSEAVIRAFAQCVAENSDVVLDIEAVVRRDVSLGEVSAIADRIAEEGGPNCFELSGLTQ